MSIDKVRQYFSSLGMESRVLEFDVSSATVDLAAQALSVRPARIAKTLSFKIDDGCILIVTAGDAKIDNSKYKAKFHSKAKMLAYEEVEPLTGSAVGGVCPFAVPGHVPVYLDVSLQRFHTVFPACGSDNSAIELGCDELFTLSGALEWIDVCKDWEVGNDPMFDSTLYPDADGMTDGEIRLVLDRMAQADPKTGFVPVYQYHIERVADGRIAGNIELRLGYVRGTYYGGNIGYTVQEAFRGNGYAAKAVKLLLPLAKRQGMPYLIISCGVDNEASRKTIERAGGQLVELTQVPSYTEMYRAGKRGEQRLYRIDL